MSFHQLNMDRCEAWSIEYNHRAHRALEGCGFKKTGVARQAAFVNGRTWNGFYFDVLRDEYLKNRQRLLEETLGDKLTVYLKKHCTIEGY
jgi:RimJ/RimL family protein N-acetyltransferase